MLKDNQDAFGHEYQDYVSGIAGHEVIERDDGYVDVSGGPQVYFTQYKDWHPIEKKAMRYVSGRVLDIGCGAGRHALYLQGRGHEVLGIDSSPLAVEVCRQRGLRDARLVPITRIGPRLGTFDTVIMLGNNFGLAGSPAGARRLLKRLRGLTSTRGNIIAGTRDPYLTDDPAHLAYHAANRARGRMSGQIRLRARYRQYATPWFDWLVVSRDELESILEGTGWAVSRYIDSEDSHYMAIIGKEKA
jgi:SAM-dependent methyltransferase